MHDCACIHDISCIFQILIDVYISLKAMVLYRDTCPWQGEMGALNDHLKRCDFVKAPCTNEDGNRRMQRRYISSHSVNECGHRRQIME